MISQRSSFTFNNALMVS